MKSSVIEHKNLPLNSDPIFLNEEFFILEKKAKTLYELCQTIDPFRPLTEEEKLKLKEFNLHLIDDPYRLTALLITMMEDTMLEIDKLKKTYIKM